MLAGLGASECLWYLDRPVSNSGRLRRMLEDVAAEEAWPWRVELVTDPDPVLAASGETVVTSDSVILDRCDRWLNLAREVVAASVPGAWIVDLSGS